MSDSVVRWQPLRDMVTLRESMNRLFDESTLKPGSLFAGEHGTLALDMYQTKEDVIVKAIVPGIKPEDIEISVTGDTLTIKGEFKEEEKVEKDQYVYQERRLGEFCRQVTLPTRIKADQAKAEFEHGVLRLTLPKAEEAKPKSIKVKVK